MFNVWNTNLYCMGSISTTVCQQKTFLNIPYFSPYSISLFIDFKESWSLTESVILDFFFSNSELLEKLCLSLYDVLRPLIIHIIHLETLSELCSILKNEMLEDHVHNNGRLFSPELLVCYVRYLVLCHQDSAVAELSMQCKCIHLDSFCTCHANQPHTHMHVYVYIE